MTILRVSIFGVFWFAATHAQAGIVHWDGLSGLRPDEITPAFSLTDTASSDPDLLGGILTLQTDIDSERMGYSMTGAMITMPATPEIQFNMRMASQSTSFPTLRTGAAVTITTQSSVGNVVYFGIDEVFFLTTGGLRGPEATIDTDSAFHDYRIEVDGLLSGNAIRLYQDNSLVLAHTLITDAGNYGTNPRIFLGTTPLLPMGHPSGLHFNTMQPQFLSHQVFFSFHSVASYLGRSQEKADVATMCVGDAPRSQLTNWLRAQCVIKTTHSLRGW